MLNLAVLISGRGSNLLSLLNESKKPDFPARITMVISDNPEAGGLEHAKEASINYEVVNPKEFSSKNEFESQLNLYLEACEVDFICLAGFMRILSKDFVERWYDKIINIHPSLLPDYKGLNTHERVLNDGKSITGCTVHYVRADIDNGPIILQKEVKVLEGDTPESLADRVLVQEHIAYPEAIRLLAAHMHNNKQVAK
jgi:phosphoribosylglycinamide formyltransferase-1